MCVVVLWVEIRGVFMIKLFIFINVVVFCVELFVGDELLCIFVFWLFGILGVGLWSGFMLW